MIGVCITDSRQNPNVNEATINEDTPYSIARLIQYVYLDDYSYGYGSLPSAKRQQDYLKDQYDSGCAQQLLPGLYQLVPYRSSGFSFYNDDDRDVDAERLEVIVDIEMAKVATKYQVNGLTTLIQENLVSFLERKARQKRYREIIAEMYPKIHQVMAANLKSDELLSDRMVEVLMAYKFETFTKKAPYTTYISPNPAIDRSDIVLRFQRLIARYVSRGGIFAVKLVHALENALQKSLQDPEWPLECLESDKVDGTDFGSRPIDCPVDGMARTEDWMD